MRNRSILLMGMLFFAGVVSAEIKIGYVDFARVLKESPQVAKEKKKMEKEVVSTEKVLGGYQKEIKKLQSKLETDGGVMSETQRRKVENQIRQKVREAKRTQDEFREDVNTRNNELVGALQRKVYKISKEIAEKENYDLLLHSGALHVSGQIDITDKVMEKLGK